MFVFICSRALFGCSGDYDGHVQCSSSYLVECSMQLKICTEFVANHRRGYVLKDFFLFLDPRSFCSFC